MTPQRPTLGERLLIVLGAGASYGAREAPSPPLGARLLEYVGSYIAKHQTDPFRPSPLDRDEGGHARGLIQSAIERGETFEAMVNRVRREAEYPAYDESLRELTLAIVGALHYERVCLRVDEAFAPKPDHYDNLISLIIDAGWSKENASFVSLNYDLLIEEALKRVTPEPRADYPDDLTVAFDWRLYKPHGSVNWCAASPLPEFNRGGPIAELSAAGITLPLVSRTVRPSQMAGHRSYAPVVAHYAQKKPGDVNAAHLEYVRTRAIAEAKQSTRAIVIGVHIPEDLDDDPPLAAVLSSLRGKRVLYIAGPCAQAEASAATELGFEARQIGFGEAVENGGVIESFLA